MSDSYQPSPELLAFAEQLRSDYRSLTPTAGDPDEVAAVREIAIPATNPDRVVPARLYVPVSRGQRPPVVLFVHGGGFVSGDLDTHDVMARALAIRSEALVVSIDYRLAPEHPFPAGLEDTYATLQWLAAHADEIGGDPGRIAVAGDSAGGNLAAAACLVARDRGGPRIAAQVLLYAVIDGNGETESWRQLADAHFPTNQVMKPVMEAYVPGGGTRRRDPLVAPLRGALHDLPPALVVAAGLDPLKDENWAYADKLRRAGIHVQAAEYPNVEHGFVQFFKDSVNQPMGEQAIEQSAAFLRNAFGTN